MTATVMDDPLLRDKSGVFKDRQDAGRYLAEAMEEFRGRDAVVLAIPSGGVPVGLEIASRLGLPFDLLIIRKIPIPGNTEAGFGAISLEGDVILNEQMVKYLGLTEEDIQEQMAPVRAELAARNRIFREGRPWPELEGRTGIIVDDGLASGFTMMTAARMVRRRKPASIVVAVPTASASTIESLRDEVEVIICPNIRSTRYFAVAEAYVNWYDLEREEVVGLLKEHGYLSR